MNKKEIQGFDVSKKTAAVIGCGGLGCNIAVHLAGEGIGKIYLCDFDTVSENNLNRQFLYGKNDIGKLKSEAAAKRLSEYAVDTEFIPVSRKITDISDMDFAEDCDIVFLAVDNNRTRKTVTAFCTERKTALVNGGINGFFGTVYLYVPDKTPCPDCAGITNLENKEIVSVSSQAGITGALEAQIGTEYLLSPNTDSAGKLYICDDGVVTRLNIKKNPDCKICNKNKG